MCHKFLGEDLQMRLVSAWYVLFSDSGVEIAYINLHGPSGVSQKQWKLYFLDNHLWWNLGEQIWPGIKANNLPVVNSIIPSTEEGATGEVHIKSMLIASSMGWLIMSSYLLYRPNTEFYKTVLQWLHDHAQTLPWEVVHQQLYFHHDMLPGHHKYIFGETQHTKALTYSILHWPCSSLP